MKKVLIIGGILVVAIIGVLIFGVSNLGPIIQKGVNTYGPKITKTQVELGDVNVSIFSGRASLSDFFLGNPKGFKTSQAIRLGSVLVDVDETSLAGDTIVIDKIEILGPEITYEKVRGTDNFQTILNNVKEATGGTRSSGQPSKKAESQGSGKKLVIKDFLLSGGKVTLAESILAGKTFTVPLQEIRLKNIGTKGQGVPPAEAIQQILAVVYKEITSPAMAQALSQELKKLGADVENLKTLGKDTKKQLETAGEGLKKDLETSGEDVKKNLEDIKGNLKGLMGN
jgi:uncharacterized protein involved in outer membrane biogenesis